MTWFAFQGKNNGKAIDLASVQEKIAVSFGFHGYATEAEAEHNPNAVNFLTGGEADLLINDYNQAVAGGQQPGGPNANILNPVNDVKAVVQSSGVGAPIHSIEEFLSRLTAGNTWLRVGEFLLGSLLLLAGALHLSGHPADIGDIAKMTPVGRGISKVLK